MNLLEARILQARIKEAKTENELSEVIKNALISENIVDPIESNVQVKQNNVADAVLNTVGEVKENDTIKKSDSTVESLKHKIELKKVKTKKKLEE